MDADSLMMSMDCQKEIRSHLLIVKVKMGKEWLEIYICFYA